MFLARPMTKGAENDADEKLARFGQCGWRRWFAAVHPIGSMNLVSGEAQRAARVHTFTGRFWKLQRIMELTKGALGNFL